MTEVEQTITSNVIKVIRELKTGGAATTTMKFSPEPHPGVAVGAHVRPVPALYAQALMAAKSKAIHIALVEMLSKEATSWLCKYCGNSSGLTAHASRDCKRRPPCTVTLAHLRSLVERGHPIFPEGIRCPFESSLATSSPAQRLLYGLTVLVDIPAQMAADGVVRRDGLDALAADVLQRIPVVIDYVWDKP
jgi:hypothetical protein